MIQLDHGNLRLSSSSKYIRSVTFGFDSNHSTLCLSGCSSTKDHDLSSDPIFGAQVKKSSDPGSPESVIPICSGDFVTIYEIFIKYISKLYQPCKEQKLVFKDQSGVVADLLPKLASYKQEIIARVIFDLSAYLRAKGIWSSDKKAVCIFDNSGNESKNFNYWKKYLEGLMNGDACSLKEAAHERPNGWNLSEVESELINFKLPKNK